MDLKVYYITSAMVMIYFSVRSPDGQDISFGAPTIEDCFEALTIVVNRGFQLLHIELVDGSQSMLLEAEAFDGSSLIKPLQELQQEWEQILYTH